MFTLKYLALLFGFEKHFCGIYSWLTIFFFSTLCHSAAFRPLLFLIRSHKLFKLLCHCRWWVPFSSAAFKTFFTLVFKNLTMMFWDTDLFVFILLIVHELLSCVHYYEPSKLGSFLLLFLLFFFPFFPSPCPLGVPLYFMLVSHRSLGLSTFFFFLSFFPLLTFFFLLTSFHIHWFFLLPFSNLLSAFSEILCYRYWFLGSKIPLWFSFIISLFYQGSVFVDCHHVSLYVLNMVFFTFEHIYNTCFEVFVCQV